MQREFSQNLNLKKRKMNVSFQTNLTSTSLISLTCNPSCSPIELHDHYLQTQINKIDALCQVSGNQSTIKHRTKLSEYKESSIEYKTNCCEIKDPVKEIMEQFEITIETTPSNIALSHQYLKNLCKNKKNRINLSKKEMQLQKTFINNLDILAKNIVVVNQPGNECNLAVTDEAIYAYHALAHDKESGLIIVQNEARRSLIQGCSNFLFKILKFYVAIGALSLVVQTTDGNLPVVMLAFVVSVLDLLFVPYLRNFIE